MAKTGQPIELPLLKDIGWAIIDYLQNDRPATNSECLFVRHRAPFTFNAFGDRNDFNKELYRYILKTDLNIPEGQRHGMHSLRSTLAGNMHEIKITATHYFGSAGASVCQHYAAQMRPRSRGGVCKWRCLREKVHKQLFE